MTDEQAADITRAWREAAGYWTKHALLVRALFAPLTEKLLAAAALPAGAQVLDIAGGAGEPSLVIAERIAPDGFVTCTDIAPEMIAGARRRAADAGISNIAFAICPADSLPFADNSFDAAVCRFGAMFFPDTIAALREIRRVLRPGGRAVLAVWGPPESNPFFTVSRSVLARYIPPPPELDPDAPGAFRYAERDKLAALGRAAGAREVHEEVFDFRTSVPLTLAEFWPFQYELSDTLRGKVASLSVAQQDNLAREVNTAMQPFFVNGVLDLPFRVLIVTAHK